MSNDTVIIQGDPPISPLLGSHSISLVFPPGSQTSPVFAESESFNKMSIPVAKFHMRERCWENHILTLHFYRPNIALTFKLTKLKFQHYGHTGNMATVINKCVFFVIFKNYVNYCLKYVNYDREIWLLATTLESSTLIAPTTRKRQLIASSGFSLLQTIGCPDEIIHI